MKPWQIQAKFLSRAEQLKDQGLVKKYSAVTSLAVPADYSANPHQTGGTNTGLRKRKRC